MSSPVFVGDSRIAGDETRVAARADDQAISRKPAAMKFRPINGDAACELLERRWFAAQKAASLARADCEVLLEAIQSSRAAWNCARARLAELEILRDWLGDQLAAVDADSNERASGDSGADGYRARTPTARLIPVRR